MNYRSSIGIGNWYVKIIQIGDKNIVERLRLPVFSNVVCTLYTHVIYIYYSIMHKSNNNKVQIKTKL